MILTFSHSLRKGLRMLTIFLPLRLFPVDVNTNKFDERIHVVAAQVDVSVKKTHPSEETYTRNEFKVF